MAAVKGIKSANGGFQNEKQIVKTVYDFSKDAGATGALDIFEASSDIVITGFYAKVLTTCTSGGSMVLDVGVSGGDTDILLDGVAVASLTANSMHIPPVVEGTPNVLALPMKLASGGKIIQTIGTAALTAGKIEYVFEFMKF